MPDRVPDRASIPPGREAEARAVLLGSLAHLLDELALLRGIVGRVPAPVLDGRPTPSDRTLKEFYALVAAADDAVFIPAVRALAEGDGGVVERPDDDALLADFEEGAGIEAVLDRVTAAREALLAAFEALPPDAWHRTVTVGAEAYDGYGLAHHAVAATGERLREAGYRLHESRLTDRPQGLPK